MRLSDINPHIRFAEVIRLPSQTVSHIACDTRITYVIHGDGTFICNGASYKIGRNTLLIIPPSNEYRYICEKALEIISINFDYTKSRSNITTAIFPKTVSEFDKREVTETPCFEEAALLNSLTRLDNASELEGDLLNLLDEFLSKRNFSSEIASAMLKGIIFKILRFVAADKRTAGKAENILSYIKDNYSQDLSNEHLGVLFGYHPYHINRLIKAATGMTVHKYLNLTRIEAGKKLLRETDKSVTEIAELCGYDGICAFSRDFKQFIGTTPGRYRKNNTL